MGLECKNVSSLTVKKIYSWGLNSFTGLDTINIFKLFLEPFMVSWSQNKEKKPKNCKITLKMICNQIKITCSKCDLRSDQDHDLEYCKKSDLQWDHLIKKWSKIRSRSLFTQKNLKDLYEKLRFFYFLNYDMGNRNFLKNFYNFWLG